MPPKKRRANETSDESDFLSDSTDDSDFSNAASFAAKSSKRNATRPAATSRKSTARDSDDLEAALRLSLEEQQTKSTSVAAVVVPLETGANPAGRSSPGHEETKLKPQVKLEDEVQSGNDSDPESEFEGNESSSSAAESDFSQDSDPDESDFDGAAGKAKKSATKPAPKKAAAKPAKKPTTTASAVKKVTKPAVTKAKAPVKSVPVARKENVKPLKAASVKPTLPAAKKASGTGSGGGVSVSKSAQKPISSLLMANRPRLKVGLSKRVRVANPLHPHLARDDD